MHAHILKTPSIKARLDEPQNINLNKEKGEIKVARAEERLEVLTEHAYGTWRAQKG